MEGVTDPEGRPSTPSDVSLPPAGESRQAGLISIIMPCHNQLEHTRLCVESVRRHTRAPWEICFVDNGSNDGTAAYFEALRAAEPATVKIITNAENRGYPAACNQGLAVARGEYVVLLNNDVVVTSAWADQLIALVNAYPGMGMSGPMSNYVTPPQLVERVPYTDLDDMHRFASQWRRERLGQWFTVEALSGFALLIKASVLAVVGGLDEQFQLGLFDDTDLSLRVRKAGFDLAVAHDLFVHHTGSRTLAGLGIDVAALLRENQARFAAKWGEDALRGLRPVALAPWTAERPIAPAIARPSGTASSHPALASSTTSAGARPTVSLTIIALDEEENLPACLASVEGLFDEVVFVDTGSRDRTVEVARSLGASVHEVRWDDSFSAARNAAQDFATGDYRIWFDCDERLHPSQREPLRAVLEGLRHREPAAYVARCVCDADARGGRTVVDHVRLYPRDPRVRWDYRVHEQILPSLNRANIPVRWTDVWISHGGYRDPELRRRKLDRDEALLRREWAERPGDPFIAFNLGWIAVERKDWRTAVAHLRDSLARSAPRDSIVRKLYANLALCHQRLGEHELGLSACRAGLRLDPDDAELLFRDGLLRRDIGDRIGAESRWRRVLSLRPPQRFSSVDHGIYGHVTRRLLAALVEECGNRDEAAGLWAEVLAECPGDAQATAALARLGPGPGLPTTEDGGDKAN